MRLRRLISAALGLTAFALIAFHAAIFWQRIVDATITQPGVLGRWLASGMLLAAWAAVGRKIRGRHATVAFWLLVALLHLSIPAEERVFEMAPAATLIQIGIAVLPVLLLAIARNITRESHRTSFLTLDSPLQYQLETRSRRSPRSPPLR